MTSGSPRQQQRQQQRRRRRLPTVALAAGEESLASCDDPPTPAQEAALQQLEVEEPLAEERAETAALAVAAGVGFGAGVWALLGADKGAEYFAGYLLEQSLSIDNLFVFILVFKYFATPVDNQRRVLTYGVATAAVLRLVLILAGVDIVDHFRPVLLAFAAILLFSSYKLLREPGEDEGEEDLGDNKIVQLCRSVLTISDDYDGDRFFTVQGGVRMATPLLLVLLVVELSDVVFAVDSIPAVFGVTLDPFIVYTSNLFAILSLRGLYSFVATFMSEVSAGGRARGAGRGAGLVISPRRPPAAPAPLQLRYLDKAIAIVLGFVGAKIILDFAGLAIPTEASLAIVTSVLGVGVGASLLNPGSGDDD